VCGLGSWGGEGLGEVVGAGAGLDDGAVEGESVHDRGAEPWARSSGSKPANQVNHAAVAAMSEVGIDMSSQIPAVHTTDGVQGSDVVVIIGCGDICPFFPL